MDKTLNLTTPLDASGGKQGFAELTIDGQQPPGPKRRRKRSRASAVSLPKDGNAQVLRDYWDVHAHPGPTGFGDSKPITWGQGGDFYRCVAELTEHGHMTEEQAKGYCNLRHHEATGMWPAQHAEELEGKSAGGRHPRGELGRYRTFQGEVQEALAAIREGRMSDALDLMGSARQLARDPQDKERVDELQASVSRTSNLTTATPSMQGEVAVPDMTKAYNPQEARVAAGDVHGGEFGSGAGGPAARSMRAVEAANDMKDRASDARAEQEWRMQQAAATTQRARETSQREIAQAHGPGRGFGNQGGYNRPNMPGHGGSGLGSGLVGGLAGRAGGGGGGSTGGGSGGGSTGGGGSGGGRSGGGGGGQSNPPQGTRPTGGAGTSGGKPSTAAGGPRSGGGGGKKPSMPGKLPPGKPNPPGSHPVTAADRKQAYELRAQARADRAQAARLRVEVAGLQAAIRSLNATLNPPTAPGTNTPAKPTTNTPQTTAAQAAQTAATAATQSQITQDQQRIGQLQARIGQLMGQARQDEARAAQLLKMDPGEALAVILKDDAGFENAGEEAWENAWRHETRGWHGHFSGGGHPAGADVREFAMHASAPSEQQWHGAFAGGERHSGTAVPSGYGDIPPTREQAHTPSMSELRQQASERLRATRSGGTMPTTPEPRTGPEPQHTPEPGTMSAGGGGGSGTDSHYTYRERGAGGTHGVGHREVVHHSTSETIALMRQHQSQLVHNIEMGQRPRLGRGELLGALAQLQNRNLTPAEDAARDWLMQQLQEIDAVGNAGK